MSFHRIKFKSLLNPNKSFSNPPILFSLLITTLLLSYIVLISRPLAVTAWLAIELNFYRALPLLAYTDTYGKQTSDPITGYLLSQVLGSILLLIAFVIFYFGLHPSLQSFIVVFALLIKLGLPPAHKWFINAVTNSDWKVILFFIGPQKLPGLIILSQYLNSTPQTNQLLPTAILRFIIVITALTATFIGVTVQSASAVVAYSSLAHLPWLVWGSWININLILLYIFTYILILSILLFTLRKSISPSSSKANTSQTQTFPLTQTRTIAAFTLLAIASIPPSFAFVPKLTLISQTITQISWAGIIAPIIVVISTVVSAYFYALLAINIMLQTTSSPLLPLSLKKAPLWHLTKYLSFLFLILIFALPLIIFLLTIAS